MRDKLAVRIDKNIYLQAGIMFALGILYFFLLGQSGVILDKDSYYYLNFESSRGLTPVYSYFIHLCKLIFPAETYLEWVVIIQGTFAIICCMYLALQIQKEFGLHLWEGIFVYVLSFGMYATTLPEYVYTHAVMTESLSFSFFYLWFVCIMKGLFHYNHKIILKASVLSVLLALIRLQMGFLFGFCILAFFYAAVKGKKGQWSSKKMWIGGLGAAVIALAALWKLDTAAVLERNVANLMFGKVLYVAQEEDAELFEDAQTKQLFTEMLQKIDERRLRFCYAREGLWKWKDLKNSDRVSRTGSRVLRQYLDDEHFIEMRARIIMPLFKRHFAEYVALLFLLFPECLICSIFIQKESFYLLCYIITFFLYFSAIGLLLWSGKKKEKQRIYPLFMGLVLLILTANIFVTNIIMYGLQRYLAYTFGLFYIGYFLMLKYLFGDIIKAWLQKWRKKNNVSA